MGAAKAKAEKLSKRRLAVHQYVAERELNIARKDFGKLGQMCVRYCLENNIKLLKAVLPGCIYEVNVYPEYVLDLIAPPFIERAEEMQVVKVAELRISKEIADEAAARQTVAFQMYETFEYIRTNQYNFCGEATAVGVKSAKPLPGIGRWFIYEPEFECWSCISIGFWDSNDKAYTTKKDAFVASFWVYEQPDGWLFARWEKQKSLFDFKSGAANPNLIESTRAYPTPLEAAEALIEYIIENGTDNRF